MNDTEHIQNESTDRENLKENRQKTSPNHVDVQKYEQEALQGFAEAETNLGYCYLNGYGVEQNDEKSLELLEKSASRGYDDAKATLEEVKEDADEAFDEAKELLEEAASLGHAVAKKLLKALEEELSDK